MFSRPKILFLVSLLFVALLNPKFNPYLPSKFLIFYHSSEKIVIVLYSFFFCKVGESRNFSIALCTCVPSLLTPFLFYDVILDMAYTKTLVVCIYTVKCYTE